MAAMALFLAGLVVSTEWDSWMLGLTCSLQKRPPHGLFARYQDETSSIPLIITSSAGSDYFVKLVTSSGDPVVSFYIHGGQDLRAVIPAGTFLVKHAVGDKWCGEHNLFGTSTTIEEGTHLATFTDDGFYTLKLTKQVNGNFPTKRITSQKF